MNTKKGKITKIIKQAKTIEEFNKICDALETLEERVLDDIVLAKLATFDIVDCECKINADSKFKIVVPNTIDDISVEANVLRVNCKGFRFVATLSSSNFSIDTV